MHASGTTARETPKKGTRMDFDQAIEAHVKWKMRLRVFINGEGEKLDAATVSKDNVCPLGQWIYGEGVKYNSAPAYKVLQAEHAKFHKCAGQVVQKCASGDKKGAETLLESNDFKATSAQTVNAIVQIKKAHGAK